MGFGNQATYVTRYDHQVRMYYDADGNRVVSINDGVRAVYIGDWVETGAYYHLGGQRVARRAAGGVTYLHGDHLGSVGKTTGAASSAQLYDAYGAKRGSSEVDTPYRYTGQRWEENDALDIYYYKARWYDPQLGRFLQPDTIVPEPDNPQTLNRYAYGLNNPVRYNDPSGHDVGINGYDYPQADPWWLGVPMPSHYFISAGGMYGWGTMKLGARSVSLYLPPTVYVRSRVRGMYEIYPSRQQEVVLRPYAEFIEDCMECGYYGEGSVWVAQESWQTVYERTKTLYWSALDPIAGALYGMGNSPDLPLPDDAPRAEVVASGIGLLGPGGEGAANMRATNTMILQKNRYGTIRMIYITNLKGVGQPNYVTAQGLHSVTDRRAIESLSLEEMRVRIVERW